MGNFIDYRKNSRTNWGKTVDGDRLSNSDDIQLGAILRIADATEAMAKNHVRLQEEHDYWKRRAQSAEAECTMLARRIASLRGVITRMKRKAEANTAPGAEVDRG